jgi:SAM-dependent methyltransferase
LDAILKYKNLDASGNILEVGCGTGKATELLAGLPSRILCLDIGENMIKIAADKFKSHKNIEFRRAEFETYQSDIKLDMIISASAYHWIKQPQGDKNVKKLLRPDGIFVIVRKIQDDEDNGFFSESQQIYKKNFSTEKPKKTRGFVMNAAEFELLGKVEYPWEAEYETEEYLRLIFTYSENIALKEPEKTRFYEDLKELINSRYAGRVLKRYITMVEIGRPL